MKEGRQRKLVAYVTTYTSILCIDPLGKNKMMSCRRGISPADSPRLDAIYVCTNIRPTDA